VDEHQGDGRTGGKELELYKGVRPDLEDRVKVCAAEVEKKDVGRRYDKNAADCQGTSAELCGEGDGDVELRLDRDAPEGSEAADAHPEVMLAEDVGVEEQERHQVLGIEPDGRPVEAHEGANHNDEQIQRQNAKDAANGEWAESNGSGVLAFQQQQSDDQIGAEAEEDGDAEGADLAEGMEFAGADRCVVAEDECKREEAQGIEFRLVEPVSLRVRGLFRGEVLI
jgi:hypothetical protein